MFRRVLPCCVVAALVAAGAVAHAGMTGLVLTGVTASGPTISATVSNPTPHVQSGYLILEVTLQGSTGTSVASIPLTLPSHSTADVGATYSTFASLEGVGVSSSNKGHGITESADPIIVIVIVPDP